MPNLKVYAEIVPYGDGYAWHLYGETGSQAKLWLASSFTEYNSTAWAFDGAFVDYPATSDMGFFEGNTQNGGNVVTDWYNTGTFAALARSILTFDTSVLGAGTWDSVTLNMMHSDEDPNSPGDPTHIVKVTVSDPRLRQNPAFTPFTTPRSLTEGETAGPHSDFDYTNFGSGAELAVADSAGTISPVDNSNNVMRTSTALNEAKIVIDPADFTVIGLVSNAEIYNSYTSTPNVHHWFGPEQTGYTPDRRPYLEFVDFVAATPVSASDSGAGAEGINISATASASDIAIGTESGLIDFGLPDTENVVTDAIVVMSPFETGTGQDGIAITAATTLSDVGVGADLAYNVKEKNISDSLTSSEGWEIVRDWDSISISAQASVQDTGSAVEVWTINRPETDEVSVTNQVPLLSDTIASVEVLAISVTSSISDTGSAVDDITAYSVNTKDIADSGAGTEVLTGTNQFSISDIGSSSDILSLIMSIGIADDGTLVDAVTRVLSAWQLPKQGIGLILVGNTKQLTLIEKQKIIQLITAKRGISI